MPYDETRDIQEQLEDLIFSLGGLSDTLVEFGNITETMATTKFEKSTKGLSGMFQMMSGASLKVSALELLFKVLEPLTQLFEPFRVALEMVSGLIQVMVGSALQPMFAAMQPIYTLILSLMPLFQQLGQAFGTLFASLITLIIPIIQVFVNTLLAFMPVFQALNPLFQLLAEVLKPLEPIITVIANLIANVFINSIRIAALGIAALIDAVTLGTAGAVKWVKANFPKAHSGGITVGEGLVHVKPNEIIKPLDKGSALTSADTALLKSIDSGIEYLIHYNRELVNMKENKYAFEEL